VGHFTTSGSEANFTALICALTRAEPRFESQGARAFFGPPVMHQAGIGREALHLIGTDGHGRMNAGALAQALSQDRARGQVPVLISSTAGTTGAA
jgi:glutamate/tyrosine decarboxylase-like PLP-dependent enzyme